MRIVAIGECMVELAPEADGRLVQGFAGDTLNTAWYLRRLLPDSAQVDYLTALGDDAMSDRMAAFFAGAGLGCDHVQRIPGAGVGLYMITLTGAERSFSYWRSASAARQLARDGALLDAALRGATLAYLSGITLAILAPDDRARLLTALAAARAQGVRLALDPNLRPRLWPDPGTMRSVVMKAAAMMDIILPSHDEEAQQFGDADPAATAARYARAGAGLVVVKNGPGEMVAVSAHGATRFQPPPAPLVLDTTAAGDSFNAGFLAAHLAGRPLPQAMAEGAALAARVIGARGALVAI